MNIEKCFQVLTNVNKYADSEFRIKKFLISIFNVVVHKLCKKGRKYKTNWYILIAKL